MLVELTIRDFAIIEQVSIRWESRLNVLTGETGAGKSIIVDAVGALLGDRLGPEAVRFGSQRAIVEGVFDLADGLRATAVALSPVLPETAQRILEALGQPASVAWDLVAAGAARTVDGIAPAEPLFPRVESPVA